MAPNRDRERSPGRAGMNGLAILLAATALTLWARFVLGLMWSSGPAVLEAAWRKARVLAPGR